MIYRDFNISHHPYESGYLYNHVEYDGPEDKRVGSAHTIAEAKREIDSYYAERTHYRVQTGKNITKFYSWFQAVEFCDQLGIDLMNIETYVLGEPVNFDTI